MANPYDAPVAQMRSAIDHAARATGLERIEEVSDSLTAVPQSVLANAARFARELLSPLNPTGDRVPPRCTPQGVTASPGFGAAYARFRNDGWTTLGAPAEEGGMGLPSLVGAAAGEMWAAANLAFAM